MSVTHALKSCWLILGTKTVAWITVLLFTVNETELGSQEWRYYLFLCYELDPPCPPTHCDRCNAAFSIFHTLYCKKGNLIKNHHTELHDGVADLTGKELPPSHVRNNHLIHPGRTVREGKSHTTGLPLKNPTAPKEMS